MEFYIIQRLNPESVLDPEVCFDFSEAYSLIKKEFDHVLKNDIDQESCDFCECEQEYHPETGKRSAHASIFATDRVWQWQVTTVDMDILQEDKKIEELWDTIIDMTFVKTENGKWGLSENFGPFKKGTTKKEILYWFDTHHSQGIAYLRERKK